MKNLIFIILIVFSENAFSQISIGTVPISETSSPNGKFKVTSYSYDQDLPTLKGESFVMAYSSYEWKDTVYRVDRSFDLLPIVPFHLFISNDGKKIAYFIDKPYFDGDQNKAVTIYKDGQFFKGYTAQQFNASNSEKEKSDLFYINSEKIKNWKQSNAVLTVFRDEADEKERFLFDNYIFDKNDTIYVTDSRKKITIFDLNNSRILAQNISFDSIYPKIKNYRRSGGILKTYKYPFKYVNDIEAISDNEKLSTTISKLFKLKYIAQNDSTWRKYKLFKVEINGYLNKNGQFEVEKVEVENPLLRQPIIDYVTQTKFKTEFIPFEVGKIYMLRFSGGYRSFNDKVAQQETDKEKEKAVVKYQQNLVADSINHFYIPKNMEECIDQLDKVMNFESKKQIIESIDVSTFNSHMSGLGMWIRNNWGFHGGSRLIKYFQDRDIGKSEFGKADEMSFYIIKYYTSWLKGNLNASKDFERTHPVTVKK